MIGRIPQGRREWHDLRRVVRTGQITLPPRAASWQFFSTCVYQESVLKLGLLCGGASPDKYRLQLGLAKVSIHSVPP